MAAAGLVAGAGILGGAMVASAAPASTPAATSTAEACTVAVNGPPPPPTATTMTTVQQAYDCILAHSYLGTAWDDSVLLTAAFKSVTLDLQRRGLDRPSATLPEFTGRHAADWSAFAKMMRGVLDSLPNDPALRQSLAGDAIQGMTTALGDDHNVWTGGAHPGPAGYTLGFLPTSSGRLTPDIRDASPPFYLQTVDPGSPADRAGLKPGDVLVSVNGVPLVINGHLTAGVLDWIRPADQTPVRVTVRRPATGKTLAVTLTPAAVTGPPPQPPAVTATLLPGGIVDVVLPNFQPGVADQALQKINALAKTTKLNGVVIDDRQNTGGSPDEVAKLLGAFAHGEVTGFDCDSHHHCVADHTDDTTPLLNLPMVELTSSVCASACDDFSSAVKDLKLGKLVGTRTAGIVAGKPSAWLLNDGSALIMIGNHHFAANGESVDGIGVAVDYYAPTTAETVSAGTDPAVEKALALLRS